MHVRSSRRGATAVEFALVAPILFILVLGIVEIARGLMVAELLTHAARTGCRAAITGNSAASDVQTRVTSTLSGFGVRGDSISVSVNDSTGAALTTATPSGEDITVTVSVSAEQVSWVPGVRFVTGTVSGQCTMRKE